MLKNRECPRTPALGDWTCDGIDNDWDGLVDEDCLSGLPGDPLSSARSAVYDYEIDAVPVDDANVGTDEFGNQYDRTAIEIFISDSATVGEFNGLLSSLSASIYRMGRGPGFVDIIVPDPGNLTAYMDLIQDLKDSPLTKLVIDGSMGRKKINPWGGALVPRTTR